MQRNSSLSAILWNAETITINLRSARIFGQIMHLTNCNTSMAPNTPKKKRKNTINFAHDRYGTDDNL